jgi:hypothetical protein
MFMYLIISIVLSLILAVSSFYTRKHLHPYEIVMNWIFSSSLLFICSNIVELNEKWIQVEHAVISFWILTFYRLFIIPGLTLWLVFFYTSKSINYLNKFFFTGLWFMILIGLQFFNNSLGLIHFNNWNIFFSIIEWFFIWLLSIGCWASFRLLLKKEAILK